MVGARKPILIVGAGPVGLVTALALARQDIPVTIVEVEEDLPLDLRASTLHCATLDLLAGLGVTRKLLEVGYRVRYWQIRDRREGVVALWDLADIADHTQFPFRVACEQHKLARIALTLLSEFPHATVRFKTRFIDACQEGDEVVVTVEGPNGIEDIRTDWLIGADGGRSAVRKTAKIAFDGFTWPEQFLGIATHHDFERDGFTYSAYISDPVEWVAVFKVPHKGPPGVWRMMFPTDPSLTNDTALSDDFIESRVNGLIDRVDKREILYRNLYRVHQRVAAKFRAGRIVLVGDAAHVNNPVGALGLNSGIHDAMNLGEKIGAVWRGADDSVIDRYERQRRTISLESVQADSIRNKRLLEERDPKVRFKRLAEISAIAADKARAREYLLGSSMIASFRKAEAIP